MATVAEAMTLAVQHHQAGNLPAAEQLYRMILAADPRHSDALHMLGMLASQCGRANEGLALMEDSVALRPEVSFYHANLGLAYQALGRLEEAVARQREAIRLDPNFGEAYNNLGNALRELGQLDEAVAAYQEAMRLQPNALGPPNNLAVVYMDMGLAEEAYGAYRRAIELQPGWPVAHSNYLYALHFRYADDRELLAHEHQRWYERHALPLRPLLRPHGNVPDPDRRLRIGYVSPSYFRYSVGRFLLPILENHDHQRHEIFCYSSLNAPDETSAQLRVHADCWREVAGETDEQLAETIRADGIDILVDLSLHMAHNRLMVFARKPAPVQVTYLGYCGSTGLRTIDYRLSDPILDPPGEPTPFYSEETVQLPLTYWCYRPDQTLAPPGPPPALAAGHVTFGCLNNFGKVTPTVLTAWRDVLRSVPDSHLLLHVRPGGHRDRLRAFFAQSDIGPKRIDFVGFLPLTEYLDTYRRIDIGLDPFPCAGGTSTCDALWMGVPVVTVAGKAPLTRAGMTILTNIGLPELVTTSVEDYIRVAARLAGDLARLTALRASLRGRMLGSPLTDAPRFVRDLEAAFRSMWQRWCQQQRPA